jgi:hypothetical protein
MTCRTAKSPRFRWQCKQAVPADFPEEIAASIIDGFNARLERLAV